jgi:hypothetical protein
LRKNMARNRGGHSFVAHTKSAGAPVSSPVRPRAERNSGSLLRLRDPGWVQIGVEIVVAGRLVDLAAFLVQPHPPPFALAEIILDLYRDGGAHAREGIGHQRDRRRIARETLKRVRLRAFFILTSRRRIRNRRWKMVRHCAPERITCYGARRIRDDHGGMWRSAGRKIE